MEKNPVSNKPTIPFQDRVLADLIRIDALQKECIVIAREVKVMLLQITKELDSTIESLNSLANSNCSKLKENRFKQKKKC